MAVDPHLHSGADQRWRPRRTLVLWLAVVVLGQSCTCSSKPRPAPEPGGRRTPAPSSPQTAPALADTPTLRLATDLPHNPLRPALDTFAGEHGIAFELVASDAKVADVWLVRSPAALPPEERLAPLPSPLRELVQPWAQVAGVPWMAVAGRVRGLMLSEQGGIDRYRETGLRALAEAESVAWCPRCDDTHAHLGLAAARWSAADLDRLVKHLGRVGRAFDTERAAVAAADRGEVAGAWVSFDTPWCRSDRARTAELERAPANAVLPVVAAASAATDRLRLVHGFIRFLVEHDDAHKAFASLCLASTMEGVSLEGALSELDTRGAMVSRPNEMAARGRRVLALDR